jgi:hypothetical protein
MGPVTARENPEPPGLCVSVRYMGSKLRVIASRDLPGNSETSGPILGVRTGPHGL